MAGQPKDTASDRDQKIKAADGLRQEMEVLAFRARDLILAQPPITLLSYILSRFHVALLSQSTAGDTENSPPRQEIVKKYQLALEYMHAVWSCHSHLIDNAQAIDEEKVIELMEILAELENKTLFYSMASAAARVDDGKGGYSADTEFHAKISWSLIRGHRYQVL